jgi:ABC-type transport system involved in multi-copper enzyme maturation permease subunit
MRNLFALLALIGLAGIVLGALTLLRGAPGQAGPLGFTYENYGGPGSMLAGLMLLATSLYLRSVWQGRD